MPGTGFATLWGGSTLGAGAARGSTGRWCATGPGSPAERGTTLLQVDASDDSRPILQRLGLVPVTTTTPYVYTP